MSDFLFSEIHKTSHYSVFWNGGIQRWKKSMHDYVGYHKHGWVVVMASFSEVVRGTTSFFWSENHMRGIFINIY